MSAKVNLKLRFKVKPKMKIGQAAETLGVPISTLRYYERLGVVPNLGSRRKPNNYRDYTPEQLEALRTLLALKASGLPLQDIGPLLQKADSACGSLSATLEHQLHEVEQALKALAQRQRTLRTLLARCQTDCTPTANLDCL